MLISFDQIKKANETISTTNIKGKDYAEVNQRVKAFRMLYPQGFITTEVIELSDDACTIKATAGYYEDGKPLVLATGTAREEKEASYINKTSYIENCETSAVGRCLGFDGLGIDTSICSAEELNNALDAQKNNEKKEGEKKDKPEANEYKAVLKQIQAITGERLTTINSKLYEKAGFTERAPSVKEDFDKMSDVAKKYLDALKK